MSNKHAAYQDRIVRDPAVLAGKPVIWGTRIPVELVLAKLAANTNVQDLFIDYPRLTMEDVRACLEYASALVAKREVLSKHGQELDQFLVVTEWNVRVRAYR